MNLLPFQKEAVSKMVEILRSRGGVYNASEMGCGKSAMALKTIEQFQDINYVLIICPAIVRLVWKDEINKWSKDLFCVDILSYNEAVIHVESIKLRRYDCLILDESHYLKSTKAKRTKAILNEIWPKAKYKICLSGTPMTRSVVDCWTLFSRLAPEDFKDWFKFVNRYTKPRSTPWGMKYEGIKHADELKAIIRSKFFIRYKKSEVLKDLPDKIWTKIPLEDEYRVHVTKEEQEATDKYLELLKQSYITNIPLRHTPPVSVATILKRQGLKKVDAVVEFSKNLLDQEIPLVIFAYHKDVIKELTEKLSKYKPVVITGDTSERDRKRAVESFQCGDGTKCFIGNIVAAGIGVTLTRANTVLFGEFTFNPAEITQASSRCHRIGTKGVVNCYYFPVQGSLDERVMDVVAKKVKEFNQVME